MPQIKFFGTPSHSLRFQQGDGDSQIIVIKREVHSWLVLRLHYVFHVGLLICASPLITCAIITSHTLLHVPCNFTLVNLTAALRCDMDLMLFIPRFSTPPVFDRFQHNHTDISMNWRCETNLDHVMPAD